MSFDLKLSIIQENWQNLVGLHFEPNGFLQGASLTLFLCFCSIWLSMFLGFMTTAARLLRSALLTATSRCSPPPPSFTSGCA